jgi:hypothetical protein
MQIKVNDVLFEVPHIKLVHLESGEYCLIVEDTEVNDYVEDFLWDDYEYQSTSVSMEGKTTLAIYYNHFDADFPVDGLIEALKTIDVVEVERIFRLNN